MSNELNESNRALMLHEASAAVVPAALSPVEGAKGSMKDLEKHRPNSLGFRSFSETLEPK